MRGGTTTTFRTSRPLLPRIEEEIDRVFFVQADFYDQLMFKAVYDIADKTYRTSIRLPPGQHGICLVEAIIMLDEKETRRLEFRRIEFKNEIILPNTQDFSQEASAEVEDGNIDNAGALFTSRHA